MQHILSNAGKQPLHKHPCLHRHVRRNTVVITRQRHAQLGQRANQPSAREMGAQQRGRTQGNALSIHGGFKHQVHAVKLPGDLSG